MILFRMNFRNTFRVSTGLDYEQAQSFIGSDLEANFFKIYS